MLQSRLHQIEVTRRAKANAQHTQALSDGSWGSQIRSYVLQVRMFSTFLSAILKQQRLVIWLFSLCTFFSVNVVSPFLKDLMEVGFCAGWISAVSDGEGLTHKLRGVRS